MHLPPAYFGWRRAGRLLAISKSEEMAPWSLFTDYDRPIARRIVEEAGVPRAWFGQAKKMVTSTIGVDRGRYITIDDLGLSGEFRAALAAHRAQAAGAGLTTSFLFNNTMHNLMRTAHGAAHAARRAVSRPQRHATGGATRRHPSLKDRIFFELEFQLPARRMYMAPFNDLNFAAQVANASLAKGYVAF